MMEVGEKCICIHENWFNDSGEISDSIGIGMRLTVADRRTVAGNVYYRFEEIDENIWYVSTGFKPIRKLN